MANTVKIKKYSDVIEEMTAHAAITPGMLLQLNNDGTVQAHTAEGGNALPMFALEDELQGKGIDDAYASGDKVQVWIPGRGDVVNALLEDGQVAAIGDWLESNGAGLLQVHEADSTGAYLPLQIVGQALEAVDMSSSSGADPSGRIKVRII
jgi:hypothetical protein